MRRTRRILGGCDIAGSIRLKILGPAAHARTSTFAYSTGLWRGLASAVAIAVPAFALVALSLWTADAVARDGRLPPFVDWFNYHNAVERVGSGLPLFDPRQFTGPYLMPDMTLTGYTYPPSSVVALAPFAGGMMGLALWVGLNLGVFLSGVWVALRRDLGDRTPLAFAVVLAGLVVSYLPFVSGLVSGNANLAIVGLYAWCWALGRSAPRLGIFIGVAAMLKIYPIVLLLWPSGRSRRQSAALAVGVGTALLVLSLPSLGFGAWSDYLSAFSNAQLSCAPPRFSLPCALEPVVGLTIAKGASLAVALTLLVCASRVGSDRLAFVLLGAAMLAPIQDMHPHYWLFAYVALMVVVAGVVRGGITRPAWPQPITAIRQRGR